MGEAMRHKMKVNFSRSVPLGETWMKTKGMDPDDHTAMPMMEGEMTGMTSGGDMEMKSNNMN